MKALSKKEAFAYVTQLVNQDSDNNPQLVALQRFFAPPIPAKPHTAVDWLKRFIDPKDYREQLTALYSNGSRLVATDGKALAFTSTNMPAGYYDVKTLDRIGDLGEYPDVDRVIPPKNISPADHYVIGSLDCLESCVEGGKTLVKVFDSWFDMAYMVKCVSGSAEIRFQRPNTNHIGAMLGHGQFGSFVVMPITRAKV